MVSQQGDLQLDGKAVEPLAARMRPLSLADFYGQQHIIGDNTALNTAIKSGEPPSLILWGPPGTGKTTLASIIAASTNKTFVSLSAVSDGVKEIRQVVDTAKMHLAQDTQSLLFVDEVHRFNKSQQDALLPHIEQGLFTFIGATTENPSFELNNALLSRVTVYRLEALETKDLLQILKRALNDNEKGMRQHQVAISDQQLEIIADSSGGDARAALSVLEMAVSVATKQGINSIGQKLLTDLLQERALQFDKQGDHFYDQISALHKAVRGSAPDAALYWLARMLCAGCDPLYLARRLVRMASEDIGLADPRALRVALDGWEMQERLGSPEGEIGLAQTAVYLSVAPKSNAVYQAIKKARALAQDNSFEPVPLHLRNAPTSLMKEMGHGDDYRYAHDFPNAFVAGESYLPESLHGSSLYHPTEQGLEAKIRQRLESWHALDEQSDFQRYSKVGTSKAVKSPATGEN